MDWRALHGVHYLAASQGWLPAEVGGRGAGRKVALFVLSVYGIRGATFNARSTNQSDAMAAIATEPNVSTARG